MAEEKNVANAPASTGNQGDNTAPSNIQSPGTFVPLNQEPHSAESSLPSRGGNSGKE
jgi:hypothetical protein